MGTHGGVLRTTDHSTPRRVQSRPWRFRYSIACSSIASGSSSSTGPVRPRRCASVRAAASLAREACDAAAAASVWAMSSASESAAVFFMMSAAFFVIPSSLLLPRLEPPAAVFWRRQMPRALHDPTRLVERRRVVRRNLVVLAGLVLERHRAALYLSVHRRFIA